MKFSFTTIAGLIAALCCSSPRNSPKFTPVETESQLKERHFLNGLLIAAITGAGKGLVSSFLGPEMP
jgi:hypothetical protein